MTVKKTPSVFERDWQGDPSRVLEQVHPGCEWVLAGDGVATRKVDGSCCLVRAGRLFKRREVKDGKPNPPNFEPCDHDPETGNRMGWIPVGDGPEDRWHREAWLAARGDLPDGTYELLGPAVQGNPEGVEAHMLVRHGDGLAGPLDGVPRDYHGLLTWLAGRDIEGIVFHHPDGRMAKIKTRDFGLNRGGKP